MISTSQLSFAYPGQQEIIFPDITCLQNEHALILGPSGVGKTTLLHLLGGILTPAKGQILIRNTPVHQFRGRKLDDFRGRFIGIIFQRPHFIRSLTAIENLLLSQRLGGHKTDKKDALHLLQKLSICLRRRLLP